MSDKQFADRINEFFSAYAARFQHALNGNDDVEATAAAFAECFIEAHSKGVSCGKNDEQFRESIPEGNKFYHGIGTTEMSIDKIESSRIDDLHYLAKVYWHSVYQKKDRSQVTIDFTVSYLLQDIDNRLQIFAYITGDEQGTLEKHGLL